MGAWTVMSAPHARPAARGRRARLRRPPAARQPRRGLRGRRTPREQERIVLTALDGQGRPGLRPGHQVGRPGRTTEEDGRGRIVGGRAVRTIHAAPSASVAREGCRRVRPGTEVPVASLEVLPPRRVYTGSSARLPPVFSTFATPHPRRSISSIATTLPIGPTGRSVAASKRVGGLRGAGRRSRSRCTSAMKPRPGPSRRSSTRSRIRAPARRPGCAREDRQLDPGEPLHGCEEPARDGLRRRS